MSTFVVFAIALTIVAVGVIVFPLVRKNSAVPSPAVWAAFGAAGVLVFGGGALYLSWTNWSWTEAERAAEAVTPENMVSRLARRLEKNPEDLEGWLRLGNSYTQLEQYPLAVRAYQRANELAGGRNAEALVGMGEALVLGNENEMQGRGARFIEQALEVEPRNAKALFYGGAIALRRNELPLARERFAAMLALDVPANVRPILEQQIQAIDEKLGEGAAGATAGAASGKQAAGASPAQGGSAPAQPDAGVVPPVRVRVTLSPKFDEKTLASAPLFVIVRDPRQAGPPLAAKRLTASFPQTVEITTADSMLAGRTFSRGQLVEVVARVSKGGGAIASPGDPIGLAAHRVGEGGVVDIQIEHVSP